MRRPLMLVSLSFMFFITEISVYSSFAQASENALPPIVESPPPTPETLPVPAPTDEQRLPELLPHERADAAMVLGKLRGAVRVSPDNADARLELAEGLYRIGDLDAALDECRAAIKLESYNARSH